MKFSNGLNFLSFYNYLVKVFKSEGVARIAVAVSGGVDSMCLTILLKEYCKNKNIALYAITVNHNLRVESTEEAKRVGEYLKSQEIKHVTMTWNHNNNVESNIQNSARKARYQLMNEYCRNNNIRHLFVAHTLDDQAETVMMRILRGSGIDGISGMHYNTQLLDINIVRPLLSFTKKQIIHFMTLGGFYWLEDKSNHDRKFDRVKVRYLISEFNKEFNLVKRLSLLSENARRAKNFLDEYTKNFFKTHCEIGDLGFVSIRKSILLSNYEEVIYRLINYIIKYVKNDFSSYSIRLDQIKCMYEAIKIKKRVKSTLNQCIILLEKGTVFFYKEAKFIEKTKELSREVIWDQRYKISINRKGYYVSGLDKITWARIKPIKFQHIYPSDIIYSSPVIFCQEKIVYILPLLNITYYTQHSPIGLKISITHMPSMRSSEIAC